MRRNPRYDSLILAGQALANAAELLSQQEWMPDNFRLLLDDMQKRWDAELSEVWPSRKEAA